MKKIRLLFILAALCLYFPLNLSAQNTTVSGFVTDEIGQPLPGATIRLTGTSQSTTADTKGHFALSSAAPSGSLSVSFVSYQTQQVAYNSNSARELRIRLQPRAALDEIQIIGYGETTKRQSTGSVSTISAEDIARQPVSNPIAALQGRVPGLSIQSNNGLPGGNISVQIRGQGSIASGTAPLYLVDGVPFISAPLTTGVPTGAAGAISPLSILSPGDIASISVLKDADATAIYGSRGANGVILITTKKGSAGRTAFQASLSQGYSEIGKYAKLLSLQDYLAMRREAFQNDGIVPTAATAPDLVTWSQTESTDWQRWLYGRRAAQTDVQSSLSGGSAGTTFLFSANYHQEGSILPGDPSYRKGGGYLSLGHSSADQHFKAGITVNYNRDDNNSLFNASSTLAQLPPNYPLYNANGSFNFTLSNPAAIIQQRNRARSGNLILNGQFSYTLMPNLEFKIALGYTRYDIDQLTTEPASSLNNTSTTPLALAVGADNSSEAYSIEPQLNYRRAIGPGNFSALFGAALQDQVQQGNTLIASGVSNPDLLGNIGAASTLTGVNSYTRYRYASLFSRLGYSLYDKYTLDLNFRRDGSSRFGSDRSFGNFGAAGAAWIFSQESLIKDHLRLLSFGKLRASYGLTGNDQISDYQYLPAYSSGAIYGGTASLLPSRIANPGYGWETTRQLEIGTELGFCHNRILLTAAWYQRRSGNQLVTYPLPYQSGFSGYQANLPALVENRGWEFELNTSNIKKGKFSWTSSLNLSLPKNTLLSFPDIATTSYASTLIVGQDLSIVKGYQFLGVDPQTGKALIRDVNGDGALSSAFDFVNIGKTSPDFFGGIGNTWTLGRLRLDVFLEFRKQNSRGYAPGLGSVQQNEPAYVLNRWQHPGDQTSVPRFTTLSSNLTGLSGSDFTFYNASYLRVKNVALAYDLGHLHVYLEAQNLYTFTGRNKFDPEIPGGLSGVPPLRTMVAGLKINY